MHGNCTFEWRNSGTFGSIFLITPETQDRLDREYGGSRVKIFRRIKVVMSYPKIAPVIRILSCNLHYDPRNTADGCRSLWKESQQQNWLQGLAGLRQSGVPDWYIFEISRNLHGHTGDAEPISMENVRLRFPIISRASNSIQRGYRVEKRVCLPNRQHGPGHPAARQFSQAPGSGQRLRHVRGKASTTSPRGRPASTSLPIRRQEAKIVKPPVFTWYPQIRSISAAVPERLQSIQLPPSSATPSPDHSQGENIPVSNVMRHNQTPFSQKPAPFVSPHTQSPMGPQLGMQNRFTTAPALYSRSPSPLINPLSGHLLDTAASTHVEAIALRVGTTAVPDAQNLPHSQPSQPLPTAASLPIAESAVITASSDHSQTLNAPGMTSGRSSLLASAMQQDTGREPDASLLPLSVKVEKNRSRSNRKARSTVEATEEATEEATAKPDAKPTKKSTSKGTSRATTKSTLKPYSKPAARTTPKAIPRATAKVTAEPAAKSASKPPAKSTTKATAKTA